MPDKLEKPSPEQNDQKPDSSKVKQVDFQWLRRGQWFLFAAVLCFLSVFHHPARGWNVNTRLALVVAFVEYGTFSIDGLHEASAPFETSDKAYYEERFYSDKTFGVSLLATPFYWGLYNVSRMMGTYPNADQTNYWLTFFAVKIPAAWSLALLWFLFVRMGVPPKRALIAILGCFVGSMWLGYGTIFMPYIPGIAACLWAFRIIMYPKAHRLNLANSIGSGLLLGFAMICDFIFGLITVAIGVVYILRMLDQTGFYGMRAFADMKGDRSNGRSGVKFLVVLIATGLVFPVLFALYSTSIFGSPTIPYQYEYLEEFRVAMSKGFMGVTTPKLTSAYYLTIHPFRGVFFWSPWILIALAGAIFGIQSTGRRRLTSWLALFGFVGYLIFNSGYYMWWGGYAMGPRLMLPMFVFVPLGLIGLLRRDAPKIWFYAFLFTIGWSVIACLPVCYVDPQTPVRVPQEMIESVTISDGLMVNQFNQWKVFFQLLMDSLTNSGGVPISFALRFFGGVIIGIGLIAGFWRTLPDKVLAFEKVEVPFINYDGNTAPLPRPS